MFIINCDCGYEIFVSTSDEGPAWKCQQCGKWLNFFGQQVPPPDHKQTQPTFQQFDPDFCEDE